MIFVTDRVAGAKYNIDDLNRVESNVFTIAASLEAFGYPVNLGSTKTDWSYDNFPQATTMQRYIDNVNKVKNAFFSLAPSPPLVMNNINFDDANNIEKTLESVNDLLTETIRIAPKLAFTLGGSQFG